MSYQFTSESVSEGHPDKVADQISDGILDSYLSTDPDAKVACECLITTQHLVIAGEVSSTKKPALGPIDVARNVLKEIGYCSEDIGFNFQTAKYTVLLHEQSREINASVSDGGAGDQGLMFGYACDETPSFMPMPIFLAHKLMEDLTRMRKDSVMNSLLPDAKSQVTVRYVDDRPVAVERVVLSTQHNPSITQQELRYNLINALIKPMLDTYLPDSKPEYLINPSGSFTIGGPHGDTGLTGRKIIVDTYGGRCPHGGGAFSGKDPSKVDRSAAYAARYVAKHVVAAGLAKRCTIQLSYAIGRSEPTSLYVNLHGTGNVDEQTLAANINALFDLTPNGIITMLNLKRPIYLPTASYGHFGRAGLPWEELDELTLSALQQIK